MAARMCTFLGRPTALSVKIIFQRKPYAKIEKKNKYIHRQTRINNAMHYVCINIKCVSQLTDRPTSKND